MKIIRYAAAGETRWGVVEGDDVFALSGSPILEPSARPGARVGALSGVHLLAPVAPTKLLAVGRNYMKHIDEMAARGPSNLPPRPLNPTFFLKPNSAIIGPGANIVYPSGRAELVEHEAELALVIGRRGRKIAEADALAHVFGYLCANDVSARGLGDDGQWMRGKGFDTFAPLGPWVVTGLDASDLRITARLNGAVKQASRTSDLLFKIPQLIAFISQAMTLEPGDVILTGTPSGVSALKPGDVVEIDIEGIGTLRNPVVADN
ncbi:MAG: fumarylacetoacetate hydrolase family protein [Chloroflexi bacterium]|nr:fumarylacetoacetate hydrolase family protein [Chloroflexota bacterium]